MKTNPNTKLDTKLNTAMLAWSLTNLHTHVLTGYTHTHTHTHTHTGDAIQKNSHTLTHTRTHTQEMLRTQWTICDGADLYDESLELPSMIALRQSMRKRCRDFALHLPQESV